MQIIRLLRSLFRIGQAELATAAGISVREMARIENCEVTPSPETLTAVDKALMAYVLSSANRADTGLWKDPDDAG